MKCISEELIQKYIDGEATTKEIAHIESHISTCKQCAEKIENQTLFAKNIRQKIRLLNEKEVAIPDFVKPNVSPRKSSQKILKRFAYTISVAAACIIFAWIFIPQHHEPKPKNDLIFIYDIDGDFDANRPISQQDFSIYVVENEKDNSN